jgi:nucleoside-diphosphate-sugar epimerase
MKKVLITGASGMVGGLILQHCLHSKEIDSVVSLVRKPTGIKHEKLKEVETDNFLDHSLHVEDFKGIDIVYFCIGVYTGAVSNQLFKEITVDYTNTFVDLLKVHSPQARFCFLSGQGADRTEKSKMSFARYKGMAENYFFANLEDAYTFRPGYIYPVTKRKEPNFSYRLMRYMYPVVNALYKNASITSVDLAKVMFKVGLQGNSKRELENRDLRILSET